MIKKPSDNGIPEKSKGTFENRRDLLLMHVVPYTMVGNITRVYSPVTLSNEWPALGRLLFIVFCSSLGTVLNGFFVAAFFVERALKKVGNVFLACIGMAELIVTTAVMPASAVVLLSGEWDILPVCHALQFLTEASTYCYSLLFAFISVETYYRLCRTTAEYQAFISMKMGVIAVMLFAISFAAAGVGVFLGLDYDYCERRHFGNFYFRSATFAVFHALPCFVTLFGLFSASVRVRRRASRHTQYKRSQQFERDYSTTNLNITTYIFFVVAWIPYLAIVNEYPETTDNKFYHCVWLGLCRSVFTSFLYCAMNRNFRRAFSNLFYYCCCKSTVNGSFNSRNRRAMECKSGTGDVRVHIMHQAVSMCNTQRAASSLHETQEL